MYKVGFDNELYLKKQSEKILERVNLFGDKLYLEFGGKLFDDYHASRVLPGFAPDSKIRMLKTIKDKVEILIAINANDIERNKARGDLGITYDQEVFRLIDAFVGNELLVAGVVITRYANQPQTDLFIEKLKKQNISYYLHYPIEGYPANVDFIVSDEGYGKNDYAKTEKPIVVVTAPGPGSGKMAVALSQIYNEARHGVKAGYAKFETFPIWNIPLKHPVNLAYEAATADLDDVNMIDPFHLEAYGEMAVNYNRDVEIFPVVSKTLNKIMGSCPYKSPTDMGVNMAGYAISDDEACKEASINEIIRRYYTALVCERDGTCKEGESENIGKIMSQAEIETSFRKCINAAQEKSEKEQVPCMALELADGSIITGKTSSLLNSASAMLLNAIKEVSGFDDDVHLISRNIIEPIQRLKVDSLGNHNPRLHADEVLIALACSAEFNPLAQKAMLNLEKLRNAEAHSSVILPSVDLLTLKKLGIRVTCEPIYVTKKLFHSK